MRVASLQYGVIFKKGFCRPNVFKAFVRDVFGVTLDIDQVETEKQFAPPIGKVDCRFDLFAEDKKNRVVVDIQHARYQDHYDAYLHYHCAAILEQIAKGSDNYRPPLRVLTVVVLTSGDRHKREIATIDFDPKDRDGNPLGEISHKVVYLCPKYADDRTPSELREWLRVIDQSLSKEVNENEHTRPEIQELLAAIREEDVSPKELAKLIEEANHLDTLRRTTAELEEEKAARKREQEAREREQAAREREQAARMAVEQELAEAKAAIEREKAAAAERERAAAERERAAAEREKALLAQLEALQNQGAKPK
jgi:hypothetical protein